ncbi:MAG: hypothetical protein ACE5F5_04290 [Acidimicrobiia bacterium]
MRKRQVLLFAVVTTLVIAACSPTELALNTTSTLITRTTEGPVEVAESTTTTATARTTSTTLRGQPVTDYKVALRTTSSEGETLFIVIPPGAYTDIDLEDFIIDLIEANPGLWGVEVFDDEEALRAFVLPEDERTEEEQMLIAEHHFVSLVRGDTIRFQGPFSDMGEFPIGS